jgi:hypothetical protein
VSLSTTTPNLHERNIVMTIVARSVSLPLYKVSKLIDLEAQIGTRTAELCRDCDIPELTDRVLFLMNEDDLNEAIFVREQWLKDTAFFTGLISGKSNTR